MMHAVLRELLKGTCDPESALFLLRRFRGSLLRLVWQLYVLPMYRIALSNVVPKEANHQHTCTQIQTSTTRLSCARFTTVSFPANEGRRCLNMPFHPARRESLPESFQAYWQIIEQCFCSGSRDPSSVFYLTVDESPYVAQGDTQRRGGLHTESCPAPVHDGTTVAVCMDSFFLRLMLHEDWGLGSLPVNEVPSGGLFITSSVDRTCVAYFCEVERQHIGHGGDVEHLRHEIESRAHPMVLRAGQLLWMTDRTPHEALPMDVAGPRSFFRLVAGHMSKWYRERYTPNPTGVQPTGEIV